MPLIDTEVNRRRPASFRLIRGLCRLAAWSASASLTAFAHADLLERSPFLPDDFNPDARANARQDAADQNPLGQRVEFRGFYLINGEYRFLIKEKDKPAGRWVRMDDPAADFIVSEFDPVAKSVRLRHGEQEAMIDLVRLDANPTPMAVSGQPPPGPAPDSTQVASSTRPSGGGEGSRSTNVRRRTPPPPPQWLQERLAARGVDTAATMEAIKDGPPNFIPPPPPNFVPTPPSSVTTASPGGSRSDRGNAGPPMSGPPPGPPPGGPPSTPPPPPPRR